MELNLRTNLSLDVEKAILGVFYELSLQQKLVIYAKFVHGINFRAQNGDLMGLNRRTVSKIYKTFLERIREEIC